MSSFTPPRFGRMMSTPSPRMAVEPGDGSDMYDALRDLFLGGQDIDPKAEDKEHPASVDTSLPVEEPVWPRVEVLLLGHLPVQQSVWVMQYAKDAAAQRGGPVGLLRLREGEATLDLIGSADPASGDSPATVEEAVASIAGQIKTLIIRVDPATERTLPQIPGIDAITLLTGADQMAIVDSYTTIKNIIAAADTLPPLRLAIMGSTMEKAMAAADKIQQVVESHLKESVEVTACLARINAGRSSLVYRGLLTERAEPLLSRLRQLLSRGAVVREHVGPTPPAPSMEPPVSSRLGFAATTPVEPSAPAAPPVSPIPLPSACLASHIAGLTASPIVCPYHQGVEVAIGVDGRVHLLASAPSAEAGWKIAGELLAAGQWAAAHAPILCMAMKQPSPAGGALPVLHLLLPEAKGAGDFARAGIKPHLLAPVSVEGKSGWFCTELD